METTRTCCRQRTALDLPAFEVIPFRSIETARSSIAAGMPAVVVCDVKLPGVSGTAWAKELHKLDAELPVILINKLTIIYNRTRQAAITTELIEIIAGAEAL